MERPREGVTPAFYSLYKRFRAAIDKKDQEKASDMLAKMYKIHDMSLYDDAYLNLARYAYNADFGTEYAQLTSLTLAVSDSKQERYFDSEMYVALLKRLFVLQVNQSYFLDALDTYETLSRQDNTAELMTQLEPTVKQIKTLQAEQSLFATQGRIGSNNLSWSIGLINPAFTILDVDGEIDELKLRCKRKYVFFDFLENKVYQIPDSYGDCRLSVVGSPGTQFRVAQAGVDKL